MKTPADVLHFWLEECSSRDWYKKSDSFDQSIRDQFLATYRKAVKGELADWEQQADSALALIIVLDQFSRNMFRDSPEAFAADHIAVAVSKRMIENKLDQEIENGRSFVYMPLMHSENIEDQNLCVEIFSSLAEIDKSFEGSKKYAISHRDIVARFGRFPHRNKVLDRECTAEETEFLKGPGSSF